MIYPLADLQKMKLRQHQFSIQPRISNENGCVRKSDKARPIFVEFYGDDNLELYKPNPPSKEAIQRAKFRDKTFHWNRYSSN